MPGRVLPNGMLGHPKRRGPNGPSTARAICLPVPGGGRAAKGRQGCRGGLRQGRRGCLQLPVLQQAPAAGSSLSPGRARRWVGDVWSQRLEASARAGFVHLRSCTSIVYACTEVQQCNDSLGSTLLLGKLRSGVCIRVRKKKKDLKAPYLSRKLGLQVWLAWPCRSLCIHTFTCTDWKYPQLIMYLLQVLLPVAFPPDPWHLSPPPLRSPLPPAPEQQKSHGLRWTGFGELVLGGGRSCFHQVSSESSVALGRAAQGPGFSGYLTHTK